jgi:subtilisin family serine protease
MEFAYENADQISVANMSFANVPWGSTSPYNAIRLAVQNMVNAGVVVVAAVANNTNDIAGPDGVFGEIPGGPQSDDVVPAGLPEAMAVSAMDPTNDVMAFFSNFSQVARTNDPVTGMTNYISSPGGAIDVAAPGVHIYTTFPIAIGTNVYGSNRYGWFDGTSLAAPHVAGLVALYIAANGRATNAEGVYRIRQAIVDASLPQSQWRTNNTHDPDTNPEPLAIASEKWVPMPVITNVSGTPANFRLSFNAVPGYDYTLQSATELGTGGSWTNGATVSGSNFVAAVSVTDTNAAGQKFFKLLRSPSP